MNKDSKIFIAGHTGLVGSAIMRKLWREGYHNLITESRDTLDLRDQDAVDWFFLNRKPEYVFNASGKVGGIMANSTYPADFIFDNLMMETNLIHSSHISGVIKFLYLGSSCIYPRECTQPIKEEYLLSSKLEPTNAPYAIAKIAGIIMGQSYAKQYGMNIIHLMPTNLYGPGDNFDLNSSHVLPALIRKLHDAKKSGESPKLWGTGSALREFLYIDDLADACLFLMQNYDSPEIINVGSEEEISIKELAERIAQIIGYKGGIEWDDSKPDGTPKKKLDNSKINALGWKATTNLNNGILQTYQHFIETQNPYHI